jgi:acyl-coenzyme A synthetase/AMP-(fatty) acid ligase
VLVTTEALYRRKVAALLPELPELRHVLLVDAREDPPGSPGVHALGPWMERASEAWTIAPTSPETPALLHFTSGTTGKPKGALHVHGAVVAHHATAAFALDLQPGDIFWCTADPGWVTGTSYGLVAPLTHGLTCIIDEGEFEAERWYSVLARPAGDQLVHGADGGADADARGQRRCRSATTCRRCASSRAWESRSTPRRCCGASGRSVAPSTTTGGRPRPAES